MFVRSDGIRLENFDYPYAVQIFKFTSQKHNLEMAYMDTRPTYCNAEARNLKAPALLIIGRADRTAIGKELVSDEMKKMSGNYPELGRKTVALIPNAKLVELDGIGHLPQIEAFPQFITPLQAFLKANSSSGMNN